jgi:hypothetical protein
MALVLADRVKDTTTTTGQGTVTLSGTAPTGFQNFSVIGDGNTTYYTIAGGSEWEVGIGTYTSSGTTLSRDTVLSSSAGGTTKVTFSAGTKDVFVTYPSGKSVNLDGTGVLAVSANEVITSTSANALTVGRQGATNPVLNVDASTASVVTGLNLKGAAAAGGMALSVTSSGTNENLTIDAKGSGTLTLNGTATGGITLTRATTLSAALTYGGITLSNAVTGTGNMVLSASPTLTGTLTAAAANFTSIGATTPGTGAFTTATASGNVTIGGTSNVATGTIGIGVANNAAVLVDGRLDANGNTYGYRFVNGSAGTAATTLGILGNGTHALQLTMFGTAYTTSTIYRQGGAALVADGPGGLTFVTQAVQPIYFAINSVEKMRLDTSGNLGIGTTPACTLNVYGANTAARGQLSIDASSSDARMTFYTAGTFRAALAVSSTEIYFDPQNNQVFKVYGTGGLNVAGSATATAFIPSGSSVPTDGMYLPSANLVSISSASTRVARFFYSSGANWGAFGGFAFVAGNANGSYPVGGYGCRPSGTANTYTYDQSDYAAFIQYGNGGKLDTYTAASGTVGNTISPTAGPYLANLGTSWTNSSDARLKDQFTALSGVLDKLANIVVGTYVWSGQGQSPAGRADLGIRAQELHAQFPLLVDKGDDSPTWDSETSQRWGINESKVGIVALQAVKELLAEVRTLADRISAMENK